jgi:hypothetical protein
MHTEHLQNVRPTRVVAGWLVAAASTSLALFALIGMGLMNEDPTAANTWWSVVAVAAGFFAGGFFAGLRAVQAPILHAFAMGLMSLIVWFMLNALATLFFSAWSWSGLTPQVAIGILLTQWAAAMVGALIGHNLALRGRPGLTEQEPI